ncbi:MAG: integrin alpha [bacterium]
MRQFILSSFLLICSVASATEQSFDIYQLSGDKPPNNRGYYLDKSLSGFHIRLAPIGDINGDGLDDFLIGDLAASYPSESDDEGIAYVVFGQSTTNGFPGNGSLGDLFPENGGDGSKGFIITTPGQQSSLGDAVTRLGDVNNDGYPDFGVSATQNTASFTGRGTSYIIFGRGPDNPFPAQLSLSESHNSFRLSGENPEANTGQGFMGLGDVNGDGIPDFGIFAEDGPPTTYWSSSTRVYIVFGGSHIQPGSYLSLATLVEPGNSQGFAFQGNDTYGLLFGGSVGFGDYNHDGIADIKLSIFNWSIDPANLPGELLVLYGGEHWNDQSLIPIEEVRQGAFDGLQIVGSQIREYTFASAAVGPADMDHDGIDDMILPFSIYHNSIYNEKRVAVIFGDENLSGFVRREITDLYPEFDVMADWGFLIRNAGSSIKEHMDMNGDGMDDLVLAAWETKIYTEGPIEDWLAQNLAFVVTGRPDRNDWPHVIDLLDYLPDSPDNTDGIYTFYEPHIYSPFETPTDVREFFGL